MKTAAQLRDEAAELRKIAAAINDVAALAQIHALIEELERLARQSENGSGLRSARSTREPVADRHRVGGSEVVRFSDSPASRAACRKRAGRAGYLAYLPLIAVRRRDRVIKSLWHKVLAPRFVSYAFVQLSPKDYWRPMRDTAGIRTLLHGSDRWPRPVPVGVVERCIDDAVLLCDRARDLCGARAGHPGADRGVSVVELPAIEAA